MKVHVNALFTHNSGSRILFVNEPGGAIVPAPLMFLGRTRTGNVWRFRADLPESLLKELDALCADEPFMDADFNKLLRHVETYVRLLEKHIAVREHEMGLAYRFTEYVEPSTHLLAITEKNVEMLQGGFEDLIADVSAEQPFVAYIEENRAVSVCRSVRITTEAHEAGLETLPNFRGKGYAKDVTAEWARLVRATGAMPLYSTSLENVASQAVARKLHLKLYAVDFQIA